MTGRALGLSGMGLEKIRGRKGERRERDLEQAAFAEGVVARSVHGVDEGLMAQGAIPDQDHEPLNSSGHH